MVRIYLIFSAFALINFLIPDHACCSQEVMNGPVFIERQEKHPAIDKRIITSSTELVFQTAIRIFQERVSPIDGPRCGFYPTCSRYGHEAIKDKGVLKGGLMTVDRLIRCNPWKGTSGEYKILPNGRLIDRVEDNVLFSYK